MLAILMPYLYAGLLRANCDASGELRQRDADPMPTQREIDTGLDEEAQESADNPGSDQPEIDRRVRNRGLIVICDLPDNISAVAFSLAINNSGMAKGKVAVLVTVDEVDAAVKKTPSYRLRVGRASDRTLIP